jgi:predicted transcriptional regulator
MRSTADPYSLNLSIRIEPGLRQVIDELAERECLRPSEWVRRELRRVARQQELAPKRGRAIG